MTVARARILVIAAALCAGALLAPQTAAAQPRLDVTISGSWWDGYDLGQRRAAITGPQTPTGSPVTLFDADVAIRPGPGAELRLGWRVFNGVYAEATGGVGMNTLEAHVHDDIEHAPAMTASSSLTQITIEGGALIELPTWRLSNGNLVPFVAGGGGYLRQVHEDRVLVETGQTLYAGGGVKWQSAVVKPQRFVQRLLLRGDLRFVTRTGGVDVEDVRRHYITVSGGMGVRLF